MSSHSTSGQVISLDSDGSAPIPESPIIRPQRRQKRSPLIPILVVILLLLGLSAGAGWYFFGRYSPTAVNAVGDTQRTQKFLTEDELILVSGMDTRPVHDEGDGTADDVPGDRTDVLALVSVPQDGTSATVVSLPRDLDVHRPQCAVYDPDTRKYSQAKTPSEDNVKINSVYGTGGEQCLVKTIDENLGVHITRYVGMDFSAFTTIVDHLGGIELTTDKPIVDNVLGEIIPEPGTHTVNGGQALDYVRARTVDGEARSDFDRIMRQQNFVTAVMSKIRDTSGDKTSMANLVQKVMPFLTVDNLSMQDMVSFGLLFSSLDKGKMEMVTLPVVEQENNGNVVMDTPRVKALVEQLGSHEVDGAPVGETVQGTTFDPAKARMIIQTPSKHDSRALKLKKELSAKGIIVSLVEKKTSTELTTIRVNPTNKNTSAILASMMPDVLVEYSNTVDVPERTGVITLGSDADEVLRVQKAPGKPTVVKFPTEGTWRASELISASLPSGFNDDEKDRTRF